jgi:hypothetical protein
MEADCLCPYCGELISFWLETEGGRAQRYVEDCSVCCRPIEVHVEVDEHGEASLAVSRSG